MCVLTYIVKPLLRLADFKMTIEIIAVYDVIIGIYER